MIDTHCHLFDPPLVDDIPDVVNRAADAGVSGLFVVATDIPSWDRLQNRNTADTSQVQTVHYALGLHPWFVADIPEGWLERLEAELPAFDAVGEIGLDRGNRAPDIELQMPVFHAQMELSEQTGKSALLHVVRAHDLVLQYIKEHPSVRGIIHAFSGSPADARSYIDKGWLLGVGGGITRERAHRLRRIVKGLPLEALVLETDSPYLGTDDVPPGRSEPYLVRKVAEKISELHGVDVEYVIEVTTRNALNLMLSTGSAA